MSINKEEAIKELTTIKERVNVLGIINAPEQPAKPTAKEWLLNFLSQDFTVKLTQGYITYYLGDQWIFQQDLKNKILWCYYFKVWQVFEVDYSMSYQQIQALHEETVGAALNCKGFTAENK